MFVQESMTDAEHVDALKASSMSRACGNIKHPSEARWQVRDGQAATSLLEDLATYKFKSHTMFIYWS